MSNRHARDRSITSALEHTTETMASIAARHGVSETTVRRRADGATMHPRRRPRRKQTPRAMVIAIADRLRNTRDPYDAIAAPHGLNPDTVRDICMGRSRTSITGGRIERPPERDDSYGRAEWLSDLGNAVRCVADGSTAPLTVATVLMAIDEVHVPPVAARMMGMTVVDWLAVVRVDQTEGGTHRREAMTAPQLSRALEIARSILANGGRLEPCAMPEIGALALSRPADGTPV